MLVPAEAQRLREFLATLPELEAAPPALLVRSHSGAGDLAARRIAVVAGLVRQDGYAGIATEILPDSAYPADGVELVATSWVVRLPHCPDWSADLTFDARNLPMSNLGCATATNLGLMVADPADLAAGRPLAPADGGREADAILRYRTDKVRPLDEGVLTQ
jgi:pilus biogenesis lipoprotein CpaD